jgi:hypothetical protein
MQGNAEMTPLRCVTCRALNIRYFCRWRSTNVDHFVLMPQRPFGIARIDIRTMELGFQVTILSYMAAKDQHWTRPLAVSHDSPGYTQQIRTAMLACNSSNPTMRSSHLHGFFLDKMKLLLCIYARPTRRLTSAIVLPEISFAFSAPL